MSASNTNRNSLYKIAAVSALLLLVYSLVTMELLTGNRLEGLLRLDVLTILLIPFYLVWFPLLARDVFRLA